MKEIARFCVLCFSSHFLFLAQFGLWIDIIVLTLPYESYNSSFSLNSENVFIFMYAIRGYTIANNDSHCIPKKSKVNSKEKLSKEKNGILLNCRFAFNMSFDMVINNKKCDFHLCTYFMLWWRWIRVNERTVFQAKLYDFVSLLLFAVDLNFWLSLFEFYKECKPEVFCFNNNSSKIAHFCWNKQSSHWFRDVFVLFIHKIVWFSWKKVKRAWNLNPF